jgi:hypothetical protein
VPHFGATANGAPVNTQNEAPDITNGRRPIQPAAIFGMVRWSGNRVTRASRGLTGLIFQSTDNDALIAAQVQHAFNALTLSIEERRQQNFAAESDRA